MQQPLLRRKAREGEDHLVEVYKANSKAWRKKVVSIDHLKLEDPCPIGNSLDRLKCSNIILMGFHLNIAGPEAQKQ